MSAHVVFGPRAIEVGRFLAPQLGNDLIETFYRLEERFPDLSIHDLIGGWVLAEALAMNPQGQA